MKHKSNIFILFATLFLTITGCGENVHQHIFNSDWSHNSTSHWHDSTCGHDVKSGEAAHTFNDVVTDPTYEHGGYTTHTCTVCGYSYIDSETAQLVHHYSESWSYNSVSHWHACDDAGYENLKADEAVHSFKETVVEPDYDNEGYTLHECLCGYSYKDNETGKLIHSYSDEWSHDQNNHWHACIDAGYEILKSGEAAHTFNDVVTDPTYEHGGYTTHTCTVCGYSYIDSETDANPIIIVWKNWDNTILETDIGVKYGTTPSYDGSTPTKDSDEQYSYVFAGWSPSISEATESKEYIAQFSSSLLYLKCQFSSIDDSYGITGFKSEPINIVIPSTYDDGMHGSRQIVAIDDYAFFGCSSLISIDIPSSIKTIGLNAFENCTSLQKINLREGLLDIKDYAFKNCSSISELLIPSTVCKIGYSCVTGCSSLQSITIPFVGLEPSESPSNNLTFFGLIFGSDEFGDSILIEQAWSTYSGKFYISSKLESIVVLDSNYTIHSGALSGFRNVKNLYVGRVKSIGEGALSNSTFVTLNLPYAGASITPITYNFEVTLGYIFGNVTQPISGYTASQEIHYEGTKKLYYDAYIPYSLTDLTIREGELYFDVISNLKGIKKLVLGNEITKIYCQSLKGMSSLVDLTIPFVGYQKVPINSSAYQTYSFFGYIFHADYKSGYVETNYQLSTTTSWYIPSTLKNVTVTGGGLLTESFGNVARFINKINLINIEYISDIREQNFSSFEGVFFHDTIEKFMNLPGSNYANSYNKLFVMKNGEFYLPNNIEIYDSVNTINNQFFKNNSNITSFIMNDTVTTIGKESFANCSSLSNVVIGKNVSSIGEGAFSGCSSLEEIELPNGISVISKNCFKNCSSLKRISIPESVMRIDAGAFYNCSSLKEIVLPSSLKSIGDEAFYNCSSLKELTIPNSVDSIGNHIIQNCTSIIKVVISCSLCTLETEFFKNCYSLEELILPCINISGDDNEKTFGALFQTSISEILADYYYCVESAESNYYVPLSLSKVTINGGDIPSRCFSELTSIKKIVLNNVDKIGEYAFDGCSLLENAFISGCSLIGGYAFNDCISLSNLTIDSAILRIDGFVFSGCTSLTSILYLGSMNEFESIYKIGTWATNSSIETIVCQNGTIVL